MQEQKNKFLFVSTLTLLVLHAVGIIGISSSCRSLFLTLTPLNLCISFILLMLNQQQFTRSFFIFVFSTFFAGFFIEVIGVKTGMVFGNYSYGATLGIKFMGVPLVIGINWVMLVFSAGCIVDKLNAHPLFKSIIAALVMVCLDMFIEPVAIKFDFWSWDATVIPIKNYVGWFFSAFVMLCFFYKLDFNKNNGLAVRLLTIQFIFFAIMCMI